MILVHTTGSTWYKVLFQYTLYVMSIFISQHNVKHGLAAILVIMSVSTFNFAVILYLSVISTFCLWSWLKDIASINRLTLILKINGQCDVKHMMLQIQSITSAHSIRLPAMVMIMSVSTLNCSYSFKCIEQMNLIFIMNCLNHVVLFIVFIVYYFFVFLY